jgi:hypothetical protein
LFNQAVYTKGWTHPSIQEIEQAIRQLSSEDLTAFRTWFIEFDASLCDSQIENDIAARRLDKLADEALLDLHEGGCTDL